jgi:hypothetical protein
MNTMPKRSVNARSCCRKATGAGTNPPSPSCGSMTTAATFSAVTRVSKSSCKASIALPVVHPRYSSGNGE